MSRERKVITFNLKEFRKYASSLSDRLGMFELDDKGEFACWSFQCKTYSLKGVMSDGTITFELDKFKEHVSSISNYNGKIYHIEDHGRYVRLDYGDETVILKGKIGKINK